MERLTYHGRQEPSAEGEPPTDLDVHPEQLPDEPELEFDHHSANLIFGLLPPLQPDERLVYVMKQKHTNNLQP
eukprot:12155881-Heterocapsa_arctica.AAC.1